MIQYVELRLYNALVANTGYEVLTEWKNLNFDKKRNDIGVINFDYPLEDAQAIGLDEEALIGVALGFDSGNIVEAERYLLATTSDQKVVDGQRFLSVSGESTLSVLKEAIVYPSNWPTTEPTGHEFVDNNIGTIFRTLIQRAKTRGTLTQVNETTFSGLTDSAGNAWDNIYTTTYASGTAYWQVISDRALIGLADVRMDGWDLKVYNGGSTGSHISIDTLEVRPAKNVTEMVTNTDRSGSYSTVLIEGDEGTALERHSAPAVAALGRRRETYLGQSGITADGVLAVIGEAFLEQVSTIPTEETVGLTSSTGADPFLDFDISDWVQVRFEGSEVPVERRIYQIAVAVGDDGTIGVGLTLNSMIAENLIRLQRKIDAYGSGGALGSVPNPTPGYDEIAPNPPTSIVITSGAYAAQGGMTLAAISVNWTDPTLNTDGTAFDDLSHYEIQWRYTTDPTFPGDDSGNTYTAYVKPWGYNPVTPSKQVQVRVRTVDSSGNHSAWALSGTHTVDSDTTPPPQPSQPLTGARAGVVWVEWDGLSNGAGAMPPDFKDLQVHRSTSSGFTPVWDGVTLCATYPGPSTSVFTDLALNTTWYFKFLARDHSGNVSTASPQSAAQTVTPLVNTDFIGQILAGANIIDGTITASDKVIANTITSNELASNSVIAGKIDTNAISAGTIQAGALTAFLIAGNLISTSATGTGQRVDISSGGIYAYNSSSTNTVSITSAGNITVIGGTFTGSVIQTAATGERIIVRNDGSGGIIETYSGLVSESPGYIDPQAVSGQGAIKIAPSVGTSFPWRPEIVLYGGSTSANRGMSITTGQFDISSTQATSFTGPLFSNGVLTTQSTLQANSVIVYPGKPSTTAAVNCHLNGSNSTFYISTSVRANKIDIEDVTLEHAKKILDVPAHTWIDRFAAEDYAEWLDYDGPEEDRPEMPGPDLRRIPGLIVDEMEASGLTEMVMYEGDEAIGLAYERVSAYLIPLVKDLYAQIEELKTRVENVSN